MKISNSKQQLAKIISENGGWRGAANLALFGKVSGRCYMLKTDGRPEYDITIKGFYINARDVVSDFHASPFTNWHQTILSREEYFHLYPAPDGEAFDGVMRDIRANHLALVEAGRAGKEFRNGKKIKASILRWRHTGGMADIIAYRLHKPEQAKPEYCESVTRSIPEPDERVWTNQPTIEQLAADYRSAKDFAERKQQKADDAKADADEKLRVLELAGEALGLLVSPITEKQDPDMVIAVQAGDEVECIKSNVNPGKYMGRIGTVSSVDVDDTSTPYLVDFGGEAKIWCHEVKFIRRP